MNPPVVLHIEVGGNYGGSLRALELYLRHADPSLLQHDLLLYYPTPGAERLRPLVRCLEFLHSTPPPDRSQAWWRGRLPAHRPTHSLEAAVALARALPMAQRLARAIHASGCQLVHCNNTFPYQAPTLLAARWAGVPVATHVRNPLRERVWDHWLARHCSMALVLHGGQEEQLRAWNLACEIVRCPDGIELPAADAVHAAALRRRLLPPDGILIGSLGRLEAQKGYADLIAAADAVLARHPRVRLAIFGEGGEHARLRQTIAAFGLQERVLLPGFEPDAASVLAALDLFVSSSRWEGLPLAVLEALLAGTPVVATHAAVEGEPRLHPFLAAPPVDSTPDGLARGLEFALARTAEASIAAAEGKEWVSREFAPPAAARRLDAALERAIVRPLAARPYYEHAYRTHGWSSDTVPTPGRPGARFTKMWYQAFLRHFLPRLPLAGKRVLEIGAGFGYLAPWIEQSGGSYIGLDMAMSALQQFPPGLDRSHPVAADACRLPFPRGRFDVVICMEVLEHIPDPEALLREIFRVAAPGAYVVLSSPNYSNLYLPVKLLADCGWASFQHYITRQPVDHTFFAARLSRTLARHGEVLEQRAIRLHPPLFEQLDYRFGPDHWLSRINTWLFHLEQKWGARAPWRFLGLHTCFLLRAPGSVPMELARSA